MSCGRCSLGGVSRKSFFLLHDNLADFLLTLWSDYPVLYVAWSTVCSVYTLAMGIFSGFDTGYGIKLLIWLTYWAHFCVTLRFIITACNTWLYLFQAQKSLQKPDPRQNFRERHQIISDGTLPWNISLQWLLQNISNTVALLVAVLFWTLIYTGRPQDYASINAHAINSLLVLADIFISRAPIKMLHFYMPVSFLAIYIIFTLIYWAAGGTNHLNMPYIYDVLDYSNKPVTAAMIILCVAFIAVPLMQAVLYMAVKLRNKLHSHYAGLISEDSDDINI